MDKLTFWEKKDIFVLGLLLAVLLGAPLYLIACSCDSDDDTGSSGDDDDDEGEGEGENAEKNPYGPPSKTTTYVFLRDQSDGTKTQMTAAVKGEITVGGESLWLAEVGDPYRTNGLPPNELYLRFDDPMLVEFGGGKGYSSTIPGSDANTPLIEGTLDEPIDIVLDPKTGEPQPLHFTGQGSVLGVPADVTVDGTYVLVETNASVETVMGTIHNTRHFQGEVNLSGDNVPAILADMKVTADIWYSDTKGVVAAIIKRPPYEDVVFGLLGTQDLGDTSGDQNEIQGVGLVDATNQNFSLNTYDVNQAFDADKDTHAKMLLELRYVDEEMAKSDTQPNVYVEFGTAMGYYDYSFVSSPISFFHPDENGLGFKYWIAYVDQAAKNEAQNGISYHIRVTNNTGESPVRATGRIIYHLYKP